MERKTHTHTHTRGSQPLAPSGVPWRRLLVPEKAGLLVIELIEQLPEAGDLRRREAGVLAELLAGDAPTKPELRSNGCASLKALRMRTRQNEQMAFNTNSAGSSSKQVICPSNGHQQRIASMRLRARKALAGTARTADPAIQALQLASTAIVAS